MPLAHSILGSPGQEMRLSSHRKGLCSSQFPDAHSESGLGLPGQLQATGSPLPQGSRPCPEGKRPPPRSHSPGHQGFRFSSGFSTSQQPNGLLHPVSWV